MIDIKYLTYIYSQNFEYFLKHFHFLNANQGKQKDERTDINLTNNAPTMHHAKCTALSHHGTC